MPLHALQTMLDYKPGLVIVLRANSLTLPACKKPVQCDEQAPGSGEDFGISQQHTDLVFARKQRLTY